MYIDIHIHRYVYNSYIYIYIYIFIYKNAYLYTYTYYVHGMPVCHTYPAPRNGGRQHHFPQLYTFLLFFFIVHIVCVCVPPS